MGHYASELICEKCNTFSCICPTVHDTKRTIKSTEVKRLETEVKRLETLLFKLGAMNDPPCFCCGYNGPGYFDTKVHPCADRHHKLYEGVGERY